MGCGNSALDPEIKNLSQKINSAIQSKSTLQYQISQLKFLQDAKKSYPEIKDVKEAQIQNLKLSKEIKDTENLLNSIKGNEMRSEDIKVLEETYAKLQKMLEERDEEIKILEDEVQVEVKTLDEFQEDLIKLNEENEKLRENLEELMKSDKYKTIKSLEESIEQLENALEQRGNEFRKNSPDESPGSGRNSRRSSITKVHQQLIMEIKRKSELEETLKEIRAKAENNKESMMGEELRKEIQRLDQEEKELCNLIEEAENKKINLERNKSGLEARLSPFEQNRDFDALESRFESSINGLMKGVGNIRTEKETLNQENKKLQMELNNLFSSPKKGSYN